MTAPSREEVERLIKTLDAKTVSPQKGFNTVDVSDPESSHIAATLRSLLERAEQAEAREKALKDNTAELRQLRRDHNALLAQRERDAEVKRVLTDALDELDAVAVDFGHHEAAARTMKDIVSRTWRQIYGE